MQGSKEQDLQSDSDEILKLRTEVRVLEQCMRQIQQRLDDAYARKIKIMAEVCVCVRERERESARALERVRERERESKSERAGGVRKQSENRYAKNEEMEPAADLDATALQFPLVSIPDSQLSVEDLAKKRKQKMLKGSHDARVCSGVEVENWELEIGSRE